MALVPQASMEYKSQQLHDKALEHTAGGWGQHDSLLIIKTLQKVSTIDVMALYEKYILLFS